MTRPTVAADHPAMHVYLAIGIGAAATLGLVLLEKGASMWIVWPPLIAAAGLLFRWVSAPVFALLGTAVALLHAQQLFWAYSPGTDTAFGVALVGYMMAHFRLCALSKSLFPADPRKVLGAPRKPALVPFWLEMLMLVTIVPYIVFMIRRSQLATRPHTPPSARPAPPPADELPKALLTTMLAGFAAIALWALTERWRAPLQTYQQQWQLGVIVWVVILSVLGVALVVWYRASRQMSATKARLILNEMLWRETRGEQRSISRWVQWARLKQDSLPRKTS